VVYAILERPTDGHNQRYVQRRANTGALLRTFNRHSKGVLGLGFSPDGALLATGGKDWRLLFEQTSNL
jgi:WD40 repeat protein